MDYLGRIITKNPTAPTVGSAKGIWTLDEAMQYQKAGTWPLPQYPFSRSVRTRASASAYLYRTPSSNATSTTLTISAWIKRGTLGGTFVFIADGAASFTSNLYFNSSDQLVWSIGNQSTVTYTLTTNSVYRDPAAWYHIVGVVDTTNATSTNRLLLYVNGVQVTSFASSSYPTLNFSGGWTTSYAWRISSNSSGNPFYFDGYLTGINFIDGQALAPTSFGAFDATTGVWNPIVYTGTYGTNGFFLSFSDPTSTTTLSQDYSGNGNNWTANNISVTAGSTYDSMVDVPTNYGTDTSAGGVVRGNYCVLNPLATGVTLSSGNLDFTGTGTANRSVLSTIAMKTGKWRWEFTPTAPNNNYDPISGIIKASAVFNPAANEVRFNANAWGVSGTYGGSTLVRPVNNNTFGTSFGWTWTNGDVLGLYFDATNGTLKANQNGGTLATVFTGLTTNIDWLPLFSSGDTTSGTHVTNFGQRAFAYATVDSTYKTLCTQNLPTATVSNGANYMAATLYTGTGASLTVSNAVNSISFQPDWVWIKSRSAAGSHSLYDVNRGVRDGLFTNVTSAENTEAAGYSMTAFNSNGFTVGLENAGSGSVNANGTTYVGWQWKGGGTGVSNTAGSITSTVSANTTAGFSILTYTGTGATATIGHGLGAVPSMMIMKKRSAVGSWKMYHTSLGNTKIVEVNDTGAAQTSSTYWNNTSPTSTLITVGSNGDINASGETYVSYCWTAISGYSAFGSFVGNGVVDGPFIYLGFRPRYVLVKVATAAANWAVIDSSRDPYNVMSNRLFPNSALNEAPLVDPTYDFLANGFKLRTDNATENYSGQTIIYAAFAENPFTLARAR